MSKAHLQATINTLRGEIKRLNGDLAETQRALAVEQHAARQTVADMSVDLAHLANLLYQHNEINPQAYRDVAVERARQDAKHGAQADLPDELCFIFTMEEVGEVAKALYELGTARRHPDACDPERLPALADSLREEIIQSAACFVKWAQIIDMRQAPPIQPPAPEGEPAEWNGDGALLPVDHPVAANGDATLVLLRRPERVPPTLDDLDAAIERATTDADA